MFYDPLALHSRFILQLDILMSSRFFNLLNQHWLVLPIDSDFLQHLNFHLLVSKPMFIWKTRHFYEYLRLPCWQIIKNVSSNDFSNDFNKIVRLIFTWTLTPILNNLSFHCYFSDFALPLLYAHFHMLLRIHCIVTLAVDNGQVSLFYNFYSRREFILT